MEKVKTINLSIDLVLKYILYFFPIFIIIGNGAINLSLFIVLLLYVLKCFSQKKIIFIDTYEFKFFIYFYCYLIINSFFSDDVNSSLLRTVPYIRFFVFVLIYQNFIEDKKINLRKLGFFWLITISFLSLDIIYQSIVGVDIFDYKSTSPIRNSGLFFDELVAGGFLVSFVFITIFLLIKKINYFYLFLYLIVCCAVIFLTGERANFIKFMIILLCVYYFCLKSNLIFKNLSVLASVFTILLLITSFSNFKDRYFSTISFSTNKNLSMVDVYFTSQYGSHTISSFLILKDNLFFGVGNKNFRNSCQLYSTEVIEQQKKIDPISGSNFLSGCATHPHQIYNEFLSEHGLIGTLIILFLLFRLVFKNSLINKNSNLNLVCFFYLLIFFIPILPSGSFFSTLTSTLFWINFIFYKINIKKI